MISCLDCADNLCCKCYELLNHLGLGAWVAPATSAEELWAAELSRLSCLGCAGNLCCECNGLLSPLGLAAWIALATLAFGACWPWLGWYRHLGIPHTLDSNCLGCFIPQSQYIYARCLPRVAILSTLTSTGLPQSLLPSKLSQLASLGLGGVDTYRDCLAR